MGLPHEQLSDTYLFPAYNNLTLDEQIRFANVDSIPTTVTVTIAGIPRGSYTLQPNESKRVSYALDAGPVEVKSSGAKIIAAIRDAWKVNGQITSFVQVMGLPREALSDTYLFPAYNNVTLDGQLRFGNVDTVPTDVTVTIAGIPRGTYTLQPNESKRVSYALDAGPVVIQSTGGAKIIAALRDAWKVNGQITSFAQLMGLPKEQLSDTYILPAYNNVTLDGQLRFGNVDTVATTVTVTIAGVVKGTYDLNPSESKRVSYPLDAGPVEIQSSGGAKIIAAIRDAWKVNGQITSFVQMMGLPKEWLSATFWFPAYNNLTLDGQLRFGVP
jgi:predicted  nucleic acid-binding Zn ribbon protein